MARFNQPPVKRTHALQPLSRDHYQGLVQAQHLIKAADGDANARRKALAAFVDAWNIEITEHFADEERLLIEHMSEEDRERLLAEHATLRELAERARAQRREVEPDGEVLRRLGQALNDHIRWEERELFTRLEQSVDEATIAGIARHTEQIEAQRPRNAG